MSDKNIIKGVLLDESSTFTFVEVCTKCNISEKDLSELLEYGLCPTKPSLFDEHILTRIQSASRIQHDLGVNAAGVVLVMELLDELQKMRHELQILQRHVRG